MLVRSGPAEPACPGCGAANTRRSISLCAVSSDTSRAANLSAAHQRAATKRFDRQRSEHSAQHEHFGDPQGQAAAPPSSGERHS
jgi:hypothetical protein